MALPDKEDEMADPHHIITRDIITDMAKELLSGYLKPRLKRRNGQWIAAAFGFYGNGATKREAFLDLAEELRLHIKHPEITTKRPHA
jgi:hypothetical protein